MEIINSGGTNIAIYQKGEYKVGMPIRSLNAHLEKHPDVSPTPEDYLGKAIDILINGKPYKNGLVYEGIFLGGYESQEIEGLMVSTIHRKFSQ